MIYVLIILGVIAVCGFMLGNIYGKISLTFGLISLSMFLLGNIFKFSIFYILGKIGLAIIIITIIVGVVRAIFKTR